MHLEDKSSSDSPLRSGSEPPDSHHNELNGLRRSRQPIKVAGIMMGSQDNPVNDELASVFANRRRRRRSATPVKIGGIVMGDGESADESDSSASAPFGGNKRSSYHPGMHQKRNSSIGMWGQRMFANGHNFDYDTGSLSRDYGNKGRNGNNAGIAAKVVDNLDICDVKEFLTSMQCEISAMTNNAHSLAEDSSLITSAASSKLANVNGHSSESRSKLCTTSSRSSSKNYYNNCSTHEETSSSIISESTSTTSATSPKFTRAEENHQQTGDSFEDELPNLAPIEEKSISVEQTIVIKPSSSLPNDADTELDDVIEIEPDMVKYHSGQTPHPNRVDPSKAFDVMSEAEDNDDEGDIELVEVSPGDVHYHDAIQKQMGLIVPPPAKTSASKSPSPHLAIISDFIESRRHKEEEVVVEASAVVEEEDREKTPVAMFSAQIMESVNEKVNCAEETAVVTTVQVQEAKSSIIMKERLSGASEADALFVVDNRETKAMEELFDKLVAEESVKLAKTERSHSFDSIEKWLLKSECDANEATAVEVSEMIAEKTDLGQDKLWARRNKRNRNKTIDYSSLPNQASWYNVTATCTAKTFQEPPKRNYDEQPTISFDSSKTDTESEPETPNSGLSGRKPGLCLIIDKLKSIETKLDELKTLDYTGSNKLALEPDSPVFLLPEDEVECIPLAVTTTTHEEKAADLVQDIDDDDDTLKDNSDVQSATTDVSHTTELLMVDAEDGENVLVSSPIPTPCIDEDKAKLKKKFVHGNVDIMSITTMSELGDADDEIEEEEEDISSGRQSRIEELAKKIMQEEELLAQYERHRHGSGRSEASKRDPIDLNAELDTVSERSEIDEEPSLSDFKDSVKNGRKSADNLNQPEKGSFRSRKSRSASRERGLAKIKFCWRCHQTGHESFDCSAELQPANWCPRCLESSHWEDNCWVNEQEIFCNNCNLPGHLPCVHQTNDFRQRKLVIETFGWLAFKDWFREPEFWSWWNCSGFTNVPLYKLMQHRPHVASPELQEISE